MFSLSSPQSSTSSSSSATATKSSLLHHYHHHTTLKISTMLSLSFPQPSTTAKSTTLLRHHHHHGHPTLKILAIDAAQPFDYETRISIRFIQSTTLKIAVIGFGNFGQFLSKTLVSQGHTVLAHSRSDYSAAAANLGVSFYRDPDDVCEEHPEVILLCTSILSTRSVLSSLPFQRLKRSTLFVDVLSVKEFARDLLIQSLPPDFDILCTHPMFGPESGKNGWKGLPFVYDRVRVGKEESRVLRCERFLEIFEKEGCRMGATKAGAEETLISTKGYETLLDLVENTSSDSFELYYGLFMYNKNAMEQLERLDLAFEELRKELFEILHGAVRSQLFGEAEQGGREHERPAVREVPSNGRALPPPSETVGAENS
ncbi:hypothetical protein RJ639_020026 [Escallonia herrerae]|uniref:Prephenate/arogenate dehydrogenase domain-containing protein n=1 Tax=Escallonia herrerae TaxID=1293975 RepID=A0AA89AHU1_9ASTE|nr:hypothetical protein RJ639_020026 [Escallonia herrerae]